ncbi:MAG: cysteate synthase, partial [Cyanobacteria bacterium P01_F01_bin.42]
HQQTQDTLVVSSAGNTGRAFAVIGSQHSQPICIVTPAASLSAYWSRSRFEPNVSLITVDAPGDYTDAIRLGKAISQIPGYFPEGGVHNVARRAGMGLTVIDAAVTMGRIPDHYFQAVGSGTGGIAAWEANLTLLKDGRFGSHLMRLHLSQNEPFSPIVKAWQAKQRSVPWMSEDEAKQQIEQVNAPVLTNRKPAYSLHGGVYDALTATGGETYGVSNQDAKKAQHLFEELEGIDISPAAGVAVASLQRAVATGKVAKTDSILLNITSGGVKRLRRDHPINYLSPDATFPVKFLESAALARELRVLQSMPA